MKAKTNKADQIAADKFYNLQASKMIPYPVDLEAHIIDVPENELEKAQSSLVIRDLLNRGFKIQSCIPDSVIKHKVFNPRIRSRTVKAPEPEEIFLKVGDTFEIDKVGMITEVIRIDGDTAYMLHRGAFASPDGVPTSIQTIKALVKREAWIKK